MTKQIHKIILEKVFCKCEHSIADHGKPTSISNKGCNDCECANFRYIKDWYNKMIKIKVR